MVGALTRNLETHARKMFKAGSDNKECTESLSPEENAVRQTIEQELPVSFCGSGTARAVFAFESDTVDTVVKLARNSSAKHGGRVQNEYETAVSKSVEKTPHRDLLAPVMTYGVDSYWIIQAEVTPLEAQTDADNKRSDIIELARSYENQLQRTQLEPKLDSKERVPHNLGHYRGKVVLFDYGAIPEDSSYEIQHETHE